MPFEYSDLDDNAIPSLVPLSDEEAAEFQRIMKEECGEELTLEQARLRAAGLIQLIKMLLNAKPKGDETDKKTAEPKDSGL